ncbi:hypothetical protein IFR04_015665 [Cadophora malorum]|uniref:Uncharacterized protein n=1 Tax=Cadophora malorum TaxID=108018 RepID=A0A8H7T1B4_9HELO|nr:hypothetical protein IFR04_015665 [Cadophora malorum]
MPEQEVIDLTSDDEVDLAAGSESPRQPADHQNPRPSVAKSPQAPKSPSPPSTNSGSISTPAQEDQASPKSTSAKSGIKKRKRSNVTDDGRDLVSASGSPPGKHNTPHRQRPQRKTSPGKHLNNEILWMSESVSMIDEMIKAMEQEIDAIKMRRVLLLEENKALLEDNETDMQSARRRMNESINLKEHLVAWGAQDEKVTREWSS